jgi:hypothetical protein
MQPLSKHLRKLARQAADEAYRRELDRELEPLHAAFEQWRRGELSGFELSDRIHQFHHGPNRELYVRHVAGDPLFAVAGAIHSGVMRLDELHPDLLPTIGPLVETIKSFARGE